MLGPVLAASLSEACLESPPPMKSATPHTMTATLMYCTHERVDGVEMGLVGLQLGCIMLG